MARVRAGVLHPTNVDWRAENREPVNVAPDAGSETRSEVRETLGASSVGTAVSQPLAGTPARKETIVGMPQAEASETPVAAPVPAGRVAKETIVGMTGVGGGNHQPERHSASPVRDNRTVVANLETEGGVHREYAKSVSQALINLGIDELTAYWIGGGKPVPSDRRDPIVALLKKGNVDPGTISNFEKTGCISTVPTIVPPKLRVRSGTKEINASPVVAPLAGPQVDAAEPVEIDDAYAQDPGYRAALGSVDRDRDTDPLIKAGQWKTRALIAGIVLAGLGALGYGVTKISDNLTHSVSGPRR
jgi:hypothetical protein